MLSVETEGLPRAWERAFRVGTPQPFFQAVADLLRSRGYDVEETEPPTAEADAANFRGGLRGVSETAINARRRKQGKLLLAAAVAAMLVMLALLTQGYQERSVMSPPLVAIVVLGGMGLSRLRDPARSMRRIVDVLLEGDSGDMRLSVQAGAGETEGDGMIEWDPGESLGLGEEEFDELIGRFTADELQGGGS